VANFYEFYNDLDAEPINLNDDEWHHVVFQYIPATAAVVGPNPSVATEPYVRLWIDGVIKYGRHRDDTADPEVISIIGSTLGSPQTDVGGFSDLNHLIVGSSSPQDIQQQHLFRGLMDDFSMFNGILTGNDVVAIYNDGLPNNLVEMVETNEISGMLDDWATELTPVEVPETLIDSLEMFMWIRMGIPYTLSTETVADWNEDFFTKHGHTDPIPSQEEILEDHRGHKTKISLKVQGIKKLLPYNGFYPSQRAVQIGGLFAECWGGVIKGAETLYGGQIMQSLLQPFFAPGILFNTIKSGIAVDWPIFNNTSGVESHEPTEVVKGYLTLNSVTDLVPVYYPGTNTYETKSVTISDGENEETFVFHNVNTIISRTTGVTIRIDNPPEPGSTSGELKEISEIVAILSEEIERSELEIDVATTTSETFGKLELIVAKQNATAVPITYEASGGNPPFYPIRGMQVELTILPTWYDWDSQPKNNSNADVVGDEAGLVIVEEPHYRIPFEGLLAPESVLASSGSLESEYDSAGVQLATTGSYVYIDVSEQYLTARNTAITIFDPDGVGFEMTIGDNNLTSFPYDIDIDFTSTTRFLVAQAIVDYINTHSSTVNTKWAATRESSKIKIEYDDYNSELCTITVENTDFDPDDDGRLGIHYIDSLGNKDRSYDDWKGDFTPQRQVKRSFYGGEDFYVDLSTAQTHTLEKPSQVFLMAPEYYTGSLQQIAQYAKFPYFEWTGEAPKPLYGMAMHNFLAEIPNFFLNDGKMTSFRSKPEFEFEVMEAGTTYYMDVHLHQTDDFAMTLTPNDGEWCSRGNAQDNYWYENVSTRGRYFGPSYLYKETGSIARQEELIADPSQAPNTPSYFYGKATARLSFTAAETKKHTLDEILSNIQMEESNNEFRNLLEWMSGSTESPAYKGKMSIAASVNLFGRKRDGEVLHSVEREVPYLSKDSTEADYARWIISSKFECPVLNF